MKISTKGRYALRLMLDLAEHQGDGYVALKDVADRQEISKKYLDYTYIYCRAFEDDPRRVRGLPSQKSL